MEPVVLGVEQLVYSFACVVDNFAFELKWGLDVFSEAIEFNCFSRTGSNFELKGPASVKIF